MPLLMGLFEWGKGTTSIKRRLDHLIDQLSNMGAEPDLEASSNAAAQLSIICGAFKESSKYPVCCFTNDSQHRFCCDSIGPLTREAFMEKCVQCQAKIKTALSLLQ
ncbi:MAG: hypothetical protein ACFCUE_15180 [Candidatus Bathyarchaeia archaeon]